MAHKKKHKKKGRVGKLRVKKDSPLATTALTAVGGLGTMALDTMVLKTTNRYLKGGGALALGGILAAKVRNDMVKAIGAGMAVWGLIRLVTAATGTTIAGCSSMSGFRDVAAIGQNTPIRKFPQPSAVGNRRTRMAAMAAGGAM